MNDLKKKPAIWIVSGPNGVGKTTYAKQHILKVTGSANFINQDEIAKGISPLKAVEGGDLLRAARISISLRTRMLKRQESFTVETTLSGLTYLNFIKKAKQQGYSINLLYFYVSDIETSLKRIQRRVESGGHVVSEEDVRRRFPRSMVNLKKYAVLCDHWVVFDNNGFKPQIIADYSSGQIEILRNDLLLKAPAILKQSIEQLNASSKK